MCPRTWVPRRCGRCGARRCGKGEGEECLFCGIDTTNGEKGQGKGKGKGKGPVPQQPQGGQRLPARERSRSVPPWAKGASRSEEGKFDADQLDGAPSARARARAKIQCPKRARDRRVPCVPMPGRRSKTTK